MTKLVHPMSVKEGTEGNSANLGRIKSRLLGRHIHYPVIHVDLLVRSESGTRHSQVLQILLESTGQDH